MSFRMKSFLASDLAPGLFASLVAFIAYCVTLAPSIGFIDAGELAAAARTLGVSHPTGYPLFTLLASLFARLPLGDTVIWRLNLLAALLCAAAVWGFYAAFLKFLRAAVALPSREAARFSADRVAAAVAALSLAFASVFWAQATGVEVYSLHLLLVALVLLAYLRALPEGAFAARAAGQAGARPGRGGTGVPRLALFAYVLGLGFANHMTTVLLLPALAFGYFAARGFGRAAWKDAGLAAPCFALGLTPYLYLPIRAAAHPVMNWSAIVDWESFRGHVSGRQYAGWMFSSAEVALRQARLFLDTWPSVTGYLPLVLAGLGLVALFRAARRLFVLTLLLFLGCLAYAVNYDISDVTNYFLLAYVVTALWAAFGARLLLVAARGRAAGALAVAACAACVIAPLALNAREADESGNYGVEDYARNMLESLDPGAVILSTQWDHFVAGAWYLQAVEGVRPDVAVIDRELLRRSWYLRHLRQQYPEWMEACRPQVDLFLSRVAPFERGEPYEGLPLQYAFDMMVGRLVATAAETRPVFVTRELVGVDFVGEWGKQPQGAAFRIYPKAAGALAPPFVARDLPHRPFPKESAYFTPLREHYAYAFLNQGIYLCLNGNEDACERFFAKARALATDPGEVDAWREKARAMRP